MITKNQIYNLTNELGTRFQIYIFGFLVIFGVYAGIKLTTEYGLSGFWTNFPVGFYAVRPIGLIEMSIFALILIPRYKLSTFLIIGLFDSIIELTWNTQYEITCPQSFMISVNASSGFLLLFFIWLILPFIAILTARPQFKFRTKSTYVWIGYNIFFILIGTPIMNPYCPTTPIGFNFNNIIWEGLNAITTWWFFWSSFSPRVKT